MATIKLTDGFGLVIDVSPSPYSIFSKYLKSPSAIVGALHDVKDIKDLQVGQDPFQAQSVGLSFGDSIGLGTSGIELTIDPELLGTIAIKKGDSLFDPASDPFGDKIVIPINQVYVSAALEAKLDVGLNESSGDLQFGFTAGTDVVFTNYQLFALTDKIAPALQAVVQTFTVPADLQDVEAMLAGNIATIEGTGSLKFSAKANLLTAVNPLAALSTSVVQGPLTIKDGASLVVGATYTLTGAYQLRVQRLGGSKFRLGFERKRSSELDVSVSADIGVSATVDGFDIIQALLGAVSSDPVPNKDEFQQAGLTPDQIATIANAIKAGIERTLQLSLAGELDLLDSASAAFSYEIDLAALDAQGRQAVHDALDGNLSLLEQISMNGIKPLTSIFSSLRQGKRIFKINLLGIFNYASVSTLFQKGTIIVDHDSGAVTITDQAGANRIQFTSDNFAKDSAKLRRVLAESFLMTVTYRTSGTVRVGPTLTTTQWFFELHQQTNLQNIKDYLNVAQALGLLSSPDVSNKLDSVASIGSFGRSSFNVNSSYNDSLSKSLFIDASGQARAQNEYDRIGRFALASLLPEGNDINNARRLPLTDDKIWNAMRSQGQANVFGGLFSNYAFNTNQLADIGADYTLIVWWANAMHDTAVALSSLLGYMAQHPQWDPQDNVFKKLRANLDKTMATVSKNTKDQFAEPWGLLAMDLASGQRSAKGLQLICPRLTLALSNSGGQAKAALMS
jgi:hypothetical protein